MKKIITTTLLILAMALFFNLNTATAADKLKVFEVGESGWSVSFPMTPEEISAEDAETARLAAIRKAKSKNTDKRLRVYEMGESSYEVSFPLTAAEIAAEDEKNERLASKKAAKSSKPECRTIAYEMAESGHIIEFTVTTEETVSEDVIASRAGL
jgi:hypothetical protein